MVCTQVEIQVDKRVNSIGTGKIGIDNLYKLVIGPENEFARELLAGLSAEVGDGLANGILTADQSSEAGIAEQRVRVAELKKKLAGSNDPQARQLLTVADMLVKVQAQIIAFSHDYQMVMIFTACAIPLAIMIGSTKVALRAQSVAPDHAVIE